MLFTTLLSLSLVFSLLPLPVFAFADESNEASIEAIETGETTNGNQAPPAELLASPPAVGDICMIVETNMGYTTLAGALADVTDDQTIKLREDISEATTITAIGITLTIDLDGFSLDLEGEDIAVDNGSLTIENGGTVSVGFYIRAANNSTLTVSANIVSGQYGITANNNSTVFVYGNINSDGDGIYASADSVVTMTGNIVRTTNPLTPGYGRAGVAAATGSIITLNGNIFSSGVGGSIAGAFGASAHRGGEVFVNGNIVSSGVDAIGAWVGHGGKITVQGTIDAPRYIGFLDFDVDGMMAIVYMTPEDFDTLSQKTGYLQYSWIDYSGDTSFVWVSSSSDASAIPPTIPPTGDTNAVMGFTLLLAFLAVGAIGTKLAKSRKSQKLL